MAAAQNGRQAQAHAVQLLMRRGADPSAKNLENEQPIQLVPEGSVGDQVRIRYKSRVKGVDEMQRCVHIMERFRTVIIHWSAYCSYSL